MLRRVNYSFDASGLYESGFSLAERRIFLQSQEFFFFIF